jgi:hypothetical protein
MVAGAPFSRALVFACLAALLLANRVLTSQARQSSWLLSVIAPTLSRVFLFKSTGEFLLAAAVLYQLRAVEVACGPAKYGGMLVLCGVIGYTLQAGLRRLYFVPSASGLHPFIFGSLVGYYLDVPRLSSYSVFGAGELSDKSFVYLMGSYLALVQGSASLVSVISGLVAGFLYFVFVPGLQRLTLPWWVNDILG